MDWLDAMCNNPQKPQGEQRDLEDFPGGLVVKTLPLTAGGVGLTPDGGISTRSMVQHLPPKGGEPGLFLS